MESLNDAIMDRMARVGQAKAYSASLVLETANRVLPEGFRATTYKAASITIETRIGSEAYFFKQDLDTHLERINAALPKPEVKSLRLRIKHG